MFFPCQCWKQLDLIGFCDSAHRSANGRKNQKGYGEEYEKISKRIQCPFCRRTLSHHRPQSSEVSCTLQRLRWPLCCGDRRRRRRWHGARCLFSRRFEPGPQHSVVRALCPSTASWRTVPRHPKAWNDANVPSLTELDSVFCWSPYFTPSVPPQLLLFRIMVSRTGIVSLRSCEGPCCHGHRRQVDSKGDYVERSRSEVQLLVVIAASCLSVCGAHQDLSWPVIVGVESWLGLVIIIVRALEPATSQEGRTGASRAAQPQRQDL